MDLEARASGLNLLSQGYFARIVAFAREQDVNGQRVSGL